MSTEPAEHTVFETAIGPCGLAWAGGLVVAAQLPTSSAQATDDALVGSLTAMGVTPASAAPVAAGDVPRWVRGIVGRIQQLVAGESKDDLADVELDFSRLSTLSHRIYQATRAIPPGHTTTYGELAAQLGNPGLSRVVGSAMGNNPFPIIVPCHRVLAAGGAIGGFSADGGARTKRHMLIIEGVAEQDDPGLFAAAELY